MKRFLTNTFLAIVIISIPIFFTFKTADGYTDPFYLRFTTPKQNNLILGTSRAAQGIIPSVLDSTLNRNFFNYSFTIIHSPYGSIYLKSIKRKLNKKQKNGIFILAVDPWSISSLKENLHNSKFREKKFCLGNTSIVNLNPNVIYLINNYPNKFKTILAKKNNNTLLHKDGWLEVTIPMDTISVTTRKLNKIEDYRENYLPNYEFSQIRLKYLKKTVEYLSNYGKVYLVRLPVDNELLEIENKLIANFTEIINDLEKINGYLDFTIMENSFQYTDGNHLYKASGKEITQIIGKWIQSN